MKQPGEKNQKRTKYLIIFAKKWEKIKSIFFLNFFFRTSYDRLNFFVGICIWIMRWSYREDGSNLIESAYKYVQHHQVIPFMRVSLSVSYRSQSQSQSQLLSSSIYSLNCSSCNFISIRADFFFRSFFFAHLFRSSHFEIVWFWLFALRLFLHKESCLYFYECGYKFTSMYKYMFVWYASYR